MVTVSSNFQGVLDLIALDKVLANGPETGGNDLLLTSGDSIVGEDLSGPAGAVRLAGGNSTGGGGDGGDIILLGGSPDGGGSPGIIDITGDTDITGDLTLSGLLLDHTGSVFTQQAAAPHSNLGTEGQVWVRDDSPNTLMFTDGANTDWVVAGAAAGLSSVLSVGNTTGGTDIVMSSGDDLAGVDSTTASGTGFTMRGGDHTGGLAPAFDGGSLAIQGGDSNANSNSTVGGSVSLTGGAYTGGGSGTGGEVSLTGGSGTVTGANGGDVSITGGEAFDTPGNVAITGGEYSGASSGTGGNVTIDAGAATNGGAQGGSVFIRSALGDTASNGDTGDITIAVPDPGAGLVVGGSVFIDAGNTTQNSTGGDVEIGAGDNSGGAGVRAGNVEITAGDQTNGASGGVGGNIILNPGSSANSTDGFIDINGDVDISGDCDIAGKLTVTGGIDPSYLGLNEQASKPITATGGIGFLWVNTNTPTQLVYTDDDNTDFVIAGVGAGSTLADVLASGSDTGGTAITTAGSATAEPNDLVFTGGSYTGADATDRDGASVSITAGSTDATDANARGGEVRIDAGASTGGGGSNGNILMTTQDTDAPVGVRTTSGFVGTELERLTYGAQIAVSAGTTGQTVLVLGSLDTNGQNLKIEAHLTAVDDASDTNFLGFQYSQDFFRAGGSISSVLAHIDSQNATGTGDFTSNLAFSIVSTAGGDVELQVDNTSSTVSYTLNVALHWTRQEGGFSS